MVRRAKRTEDPAALAAGRQALIKGMAERLGDPEFPSTANRALAEHVGHSWGLIGKHFASRAQMLEVLLDFTEQSIDSIARQVIQRTPAGPLRQGRIAAGILQFMAKNPSSARLLMGDVLLREKGRLLDRTHAWWAALPAMVGPARAELVAGRCMLFVVSRFRRQPDDRLDAVLEQIEQKELEPLW